ncbi:MAG: hypothetical protein OXR07_07470, partial [Nitrospira sp.]|nr:hypothetical protein [Nitrospira sp.]
MAESSFLRKQESRPFQRVAGRPAVAAGDEQRGGVVIPAEAGIQAVLAGCRASRGGGGGGWGVAESSFLRKQESRLSWWAAGRPAVAAVGGGAWRSR